MTAPWLCGNRNSSKVSWISSAAGASYKVAPAAGTHTMNWSGPIANRPSMLLAVYAPAPGGGGGTAGTVVEQYAYGPYGEGIGDAALGGTPFRYAGHRYDEETGLIYMRARYYSVSLGRFLSPDPAGYADGPNLYAYAYNNPVNFIDPSGLAAEMAANVASGAWDIMGRCAESCIGINYFTGSKGVRRGLGYLSEETILGDPGFWMSMEGLGPPGALVGGTGAAYAWLARLYGVSTKASGSLSGRALAMSGVPTEVRVSEYTGIPRNVGPGRVTIPGSGKGGYRVPDFDPNASMALRGTCMECKDLGRLVSSPQLRDLQTNANNLGGPLEIWTNATLPKSGQLFDAIQAGDVITKPIP